MDEILRPRSRSDVPRRARISPHSSSWLAQCAAASGASPSVFPDGQAVATACIEYFEWCAANPCEVSKTAQSGGNWSDHIHEVARPPTKQGLFTYLGIGSAIWSRWRTDPRFEDAVEWAENIIHNEKLTGALIGTLNANVVIRTLGLTEKTEVATTVSPAIDPARLNDEQLEAALKLIDVTPADSAGQRGTARDSAERPADIVPGSVGRGDGT